MILPRTPPSLTRLRVKPDEPAEGPPAIDGHRPRGSRRPHNDVTVAAVRHLVKDYAELCRDSDEDRGELPKHLPLDAGWRLATLAVRAVRAN